MDEKIVNISMELIAISGNAKCLGLQAINFAKDKKAEKAFSTLKEAKEELTKIHKVHAELIQKESAGEKYDLSLLFVHSQDHLTSAIIIIELAEHLINLYIK